MKISEYFKEVFSGLPRWFRFLYFGIIAVSFGMFILMALALIKYVTS